MGVDTEAYGLRGYPRSPSLRIIFRLRIAKMGPFSQFGVDPFSGEPFWRTVGMVW